jgi:uncharacterized protein
MDHGVFMLNNECLNNKSLNNKCLNKKNQNILLQLAKQSILSGIGNSKPLSIDIASYPSELKEQRASFVTLNINQQLRGCIGCLSAYRPLALDIVQNAYAAAFSDPRFPAVSKAEFPLLEYHFSILSPTSRIQFDSYEDLISQVRPGIDGLILTEGNYQGTFLPSVWEQIDSRELFIKYLLNKAGLDSDYWSDSIQISRYTVEAIN